VSTCSSTLVCRLKQVSKQNSTLYELHWALDLSFHFFFEARIKLEYEQHSTGNAIQCTKVFHNISCTLVLLLW